MKKHKSSLRRLFGTLFFFTLCIHLFIFTNIAQASVSYPEPGTALQPFDSPEVCADGQKIYVAASKINGDGSLNSPFNSIQDAINQAYPGDVILVKPGIYELDTRTTTVRHGTRERPICLMAFDPADRPVLTRSLVANQGKAGEYGGELLLIKHRHFLVDGFVMDGRYTNPKYYYKYKNAYPYEVNYRTILAIAHYGRGLVGEPSREFYKYQYDGDNAIIRNCEIRRNRGDGIYASADNVLIENCEVHLCLRGVHDLNNPENNRHKDAHAVCGSHAGNLTIKNCDLHHVSGDLI